MSGKRIGYVRVSSIDQNPQRQLESVTLDKKFVDFASAKSTNRPQLKALLEFVREDDVVIVHSMDRLARNLRDLKQLVHDFISQKIEVHFVKENLQFSSENSATSILILHLMGAFAEFEYSFIRERQREGIEVAKRKGVYKGKKKKIKPGMELIIQREMMTRKSKSQIAQDLGVCRLTLYRHLKEIQKKVELMTQPNG